MKTSVCVSRKSFHRLNESRADVYRQMLLGLHGTTKFLCAVFLCILVLFPCFPQSTEDTRSMENPGKEQESQLLITPPASLVENPEIEDQPSSVWLFVRMVLVLVVVVACIYFVVFFIKKSTKISNSSDPYLKVVASITLSPGKFIYVVTLNSVAYIIGVTDNAVNLIGQLDDKELIDAMNLNADKFSSSTNPKNFASVLNFFYPKTKKTSKSSSNPFSESTESALHTLQRQSERLDSFDEEESSPEDAQ